MHTIIVFLWYFIVFLSMEFITIVIRFGDLRTIRKSSQSNKIKHKLIITPNREFLILFKTIQIISNLIIFFIFYLLTIFSLYYILTCISLLLANLDNRS